MKAFHSRLVWVVFAIAVTVGAVVLSRLTWGPPSPRLVVANELVNNVPAGPLIEGSVLEQRLDWPATLEGAFLCFEAFLATYSRTNVGKVILFVRQGAASAERELDVATVQDNSYAGGCFQGFTLRAGPASIGIRGVDGVSKNAITAWLTEHMPFGAATMNGQSLGKAMAVRVQYSQTTPPAAAVGGGQIVFWLFVLCYLIVLPFVGSVLARGDSQSQSPHRG